MTARPAGEGFELTGVMPWVTSSPQADYIVTGAVLPDRRQILACIPTDAPGLSIPEPMYFMALNASHTGPVNCHAVFVDREHLLRGPADQALARRAPVKSLTVSAVGVGVAQALKDFVVDNRSRLPDASDLIDGRVTPAFESIRLRLHDAADALVDPEEEVPAVAIRAAVNDLIVRLAATAMTLAKGTGYVSDHPAQRLCREAMFFLVWSAPTQVQLGTLQHLWPLRA